jgi:hypothetical protein
MVHFPGLARTRLWIQRAVTWFYQIGFPHSEISGSRPVCGSPELIAAYHVLLRLLAPRHPPYALSSLTIKLTQHVSTLSESKLQIFATGSLASCQLKNSEWHASDPISKVYRLELHPPLYFQRVRRDSARQLYRLESRERGTRADKFAFPHCATLEQNLRFPNNRPRFTRWPAIGMPTSFSCQRSSFRSSTADWNVSAPGGAQCRFGAGPAIQNPP